MLPALAQSPHCSRRVPHPPKRVTGADHHGAAARLVANPKGKRVSPGQAGGAQGASTSSPQQSHPVQARTSHCSTSAHGSLHSSTRRQLLLRRVPASCPHRPQPPGPHLSQKKLSICRQQRDDGWLREASGHLRARPALGASVKAKAGAAPWDGASAHPLPLPYI